MIKRTFKEIYESIKDNETPKMRFRRHVAEITGKKEQTIKQWLSGTQVPSQESIGKIAEYFNVDPSGLFPESNV